MTVFIFISTYYPVFSLGGGGVHLIHFVTMKYVLCYYFWKKMLNRRGLMYIFL